MKRKNEKTIIGIVAALIVIIVVIIILAVSGCSDKGNSPIDDATTETRIETVTEIATDAQGNTYVEESTEVVEVMAQGDKSEDEKAESSEQDTSAKDENKTDDKNESSITNASAESKTNSDKNTSKTDTSTGKNNSSSKAESSKVNNSSSSSKTESSKVNNSTSSNKNNSSSSSTTNKNNASTSKPSSSSSASKQESSKVEETRHNHSWVNITKKIKVVDQEAYTYEEPVYETIYIRICNEVSCAMELTGYSQSELSSHMKQHALRGENSGWHSAGTKKEQTGTKTVEVPEQYHYEDKITGRKCSSCGECEYY